ncbi:uncharacterized protein G2W53_007802 [Senna tora]|uniref:Transposase n=1 Tax=Senna tora TaxID=362788 RepID=A0A834X7B8_9FABA|nr:uncharacterized protein G2W53_007802 [Senna tora]
MADVWNLPFGSQILVTFNEVHQPVGVEGTVLKRFIGSMSKFEIPCERREILMDKLTRSMGEKWRNWKFSLKEKHYDETKSIVQVIAKPPQRVEIQQWTQLVFFLKRSVIGKENRSKQTSTHTAGTKTYAQHAYEMQLNDGAPPSRAKLYVKTPKRKDGRPVNEESARNIARLEELMSQYPDNSHGGSGGGILWDKNDIYSQVIGKDRYGYVRGLGFGPTPSMKDSASSCACHGTRINMQEERLQTQEAMRQMSEKIQMLEAQVATLITTFNQNTVVLVSNFNTTS